MIPFWKSLKFWQSLSVIISIVAIQFGWLTLIDSAKVLAGILAVLELVFNVRPELRAKGLL